MQNRLHVVSPTFYLDFIVQLAKDWTTVHNTLASGGQCKAAQCKSCHDSLERLKSCKACPNEASFPWASMAKLTSRDIDQKLTQAAGEEGGRLYYVTNMTYIMFSKFTVICLMYIFSHCLTHRPCVAKVALVF